MARHPPRSTEDCQGSSEDTSPDPALAAPPPPVGHENLGHSRGLYVALDPFARQALSIAPEAHHRRCSGSRRGPSFLIEKLADRRSKTGGPGRFLRRRGKKHVRN